jgi:hypothetical protein
MSGVSDNGSAEEYAIITSAGPTRPPNWATRVDLTPWVPPPHLHLEGILVPKAAKVMFIY